MASISTLACTDTRAVLQLRCGRPDAAAWKPQGGKTIYIVEQWDPKPKMPGFELAVDASDYQADSKYRASCAQVIFALQKQYLSTFAS